MKKNLSDLAVFGGEPAFTDPLHVGRPNVGDRQNFLERINDILDRRWFTNHGQYVKEFERTLAELLGVEHCTAVCNATVGLEIAIKALGMSGEVIIPSFTFVATAHALQWQEITPVFCDVDRSSHNIDPRRVEELITPRTTGILGVHVWGRPCEVEALGDIACKHDLKLLFDAAHALNCSSNGKMIGSFGDAEVFSFHATKFLNTFEGGAIATNNDELAAQIRLMKNFGFAGSDNVIYLGTNGKMNEVSAAMGLTSMEYLDDIVAVNNRNYLDYLRVLSGIPGIDVLQYNEQEKQNYQYIVLDVDPVNALLNRNDILDILHAERILARRYFYPGCHRSEPYRSLIPHAGELLPETERLTDRVMQLPTGTAVDTSEIEIIGQILNLIIQNEAEIKSRLDNR